MPSPNQPESSTFEPLIFSANPYFQPERFDREATEVCDRSLATATAMESGKARLYESLKAYAVREHRLTLNDIEEGNVGPGDFSPNDIDVVSPVTDPDRFGLIEYSTLWQSLRSLERNWGVVWSGLRDTDNSYTLQSHYLMLAYACPYTSRQVQLLADLADLADRSPRGQGYWIRTFQAHIPEMAQGWKRWLMSEPFDVEIDFPPHPNHAGPEWTIRACRGISAAL